MNFRIADTRHACVLSLLSLFICGQRACAAVDEPMIFYQALTSGNCATCRWIAAEGVIQADSDKRFLRFLDEEGLLGIPGLNVHFNSPGGSLTGGVLLGAAIRRQRANTVVATAKVDRTTAEGLRWVNFDPVPEAICASACVFAFAGGVSRFASRTTPASEVGFQVLGRLGLHQFYDPISLADRKELTASAEDRIADQRMVATLLGFLSELDVSGELLQLSARTSPDDMHWLTEDEMRRTRIDNRMVRNVFLTGYRNGVAVAEILYGRRDADYRLELYCDDGAIQMKASIDWRGPYDVEGHDRWNLFEHLSLDNGTPLTLLSERFASGIGGDIIGEFIFRFEDTPNRIAQRKDFIFRDTSSRYASDAASAMSFTLPNDFDGLYLLPRACL